MLRRRNTTLLFSITCLGVLLFRSRPAAAPIDSYPPEGRGFSRRNTSTVNLKDSFNDPEEHSESFCPVKGRWFAVRKDTRGHVLREVICSEDENCGRRGSGFSRVNNLNLHGSATAHCSEQAWSSAKATHPGMQSLTDFNSCSGDGREPPRLRFFRAEMAQDKFAEV
ncbi:hypothetical protein C8F04DRAFT_1226788 [Mycena alexandri]|uniref:Uncharacterized protein n=1 Tax=Mycena alexandri TaxID=1745969 RepID=A0AAD6XH55_9AGAR|nr:hypothetical protein C8F04DRAFT_1226788 [Mycena alexandri]